MSTVSNPLFLRKSRFTFTEGLASTFDYTPVTSNYEISGTGQVADARAIASDFLVTGSDLRTALADYARE